MAVFAKNTDHYIGISKTGILVTVQINVFYTIEQRCRRGRHWMGWQLVLWQSELQNNCQ
jgi:hypothetical protein